MLKIAVADDEEECLKKIEEYLRRIENCDFDCFLTKDASSLLEKYKEGKFFDIIFLDIEMDDVNGIETAKFINEMYGKTIIIFTTGYQQYVKEAFYVNAFQYMFKPIAFDDFKYELFRAVHALQLRNQKYVINYNYEKIALECSDILYIETRERHLVAKTRENEYVYNGTISEEERKLSKCGFSRAEQGCIINLCHIKKISRTAVEMDNGEIKYISKRLYKPLLADYNLYLSGCMV